jgi:aspartyl-tRNA(Asn)/glutamyl-tRNA(Gln) amidotransferase subunit B
MSEFEAVIGLEIHAQLLTRTKMFCGCSTAYGAEPNTQVCPVCLGLPGSLPVLNRRAVELGLLVGAALHATSNPRSVFARKNYFYPDLPKNYQISQFDQPLCTGGYVDVSRPGRSSPGDQPLRVRLIRVHLEEDAGKSIHVEEEGVRRTLLDFNRCGVPLIEIVTQPELRSPSDAHDFLVTLKQLLEYTRASSGNMEEGSLRCDVNVSVRRTGDTGLGSKTEIKNLNSFRNVERALEYEIERQIELRGRGETIAHETLLWDATREKAVLMRSKEEAHDYRYFPEPDLPRLEVGRNWLDRVESELPEMPEARKRRFVQSFDIPAYDAGVLCSTLDLAGYFEEVARLSGAPKLASNWIMTEVLREAKDSGFPVSSSNLAGLLLFIKSGRISGKMAKDIFKDMAKTGETAEEIITRRGLSQVTDAEQLRRTVAEVMLENPRPVSDYLRGREKLFGFLMGQVMQKTAGTANPELASSILRECLDRAKREETQE